MARIVCPLARNMRRHESFRTNTRARARQCEFQEIDTLRVYSKMTASDSSVCPYLLGGNRLPNKSK